MEVFREFAKGEERSNWIKGNVSLWHLKKLLEPFINKQIDIFHEELRGICGPHQCAKKCNFQNWKPQLNQIPPLDCAVCSHWVEVIRANHTSPRGRVYWKNSEPHLWSSDKWEVAKVFMTDGHKTHKSLADFDIAAFLSLMTQCKHFKRFDLGDLCQKVSHVRNNIKHSPDYLLKKEDLHRYLHQIRALGEALAKHDPQFKRLPKDTDEIPNLNIQLIISEMVTQQEIQVEHDKELELMCIPVEQEDIERSPTRMEQDEDETVAKNDLDMDALRNKLAAIANRLNEKEQVQSALQKTCDDCARPTMKLLWERYGHFVISLALKAVAEIVLRAFSVY